MQGKVTLEDHFAIEDTLGDSQPFGTHVWPELRHRLLDFQDHVIRPQPVGFDLEFALMVAAAGSEHITMHDLFAYEQSGVDENGHAVGQFVCTGIRPKVAERIESRGLRLPGDLFMRRVMPAK